MSIELINVSHISDGKTLIEDINLKIESGSFNVLLGRRKGNAGKTTLLRVISGLEVPSKGRIIVDGVDVTKTRVQMRNVSLVHQKFINYPHLTIRENIGSPLFALGMKKNEIKEKVEAIATQLHIENWLERYPDEISGGQQQRTALARALVKEAKIVLLDEPLVNLDYKLREELRFELRELLKNRNAIAIYATTDPNEALALGGTSILMHEGKVIQQGLAVDVYRRPVDIVAAKLSNDPEINIFSGHINKNEIILGRELHFPLHSTLQTLSSGEYVFGIRPRHLSLTF
jgi:glycerol transport system ATP-binding protein